MRPFRDPPRVELGPLSVGLVDAAARAMAQLPQGGRLVGRRPAAITPQAMGALGSGGMFTVLAICFVTMTSGWQPAGWSGRGLISLLVLAGGASLALLLRAMDRVTGKPVLRADVVGRNARRTVARISRLALRAEQSPYDFGARRVLALRRAIAATRDPDVAPWVGRDLLGRAELLLARALALHSGPRWIDDPARHADVCDLLRRAMDHLSDPAPAMGDLESVPARVARATPRRRRIQLQRRFETSGVFATVEAEQVQVEEVELPPRRVSRAV
jgi:hypothetical protein